MKIFHGVLTKQMDGPINIVRNMPVYDTGRADAELKKEVK